MNHNRNWRPPTDVYESEEHIIIKVEIAGMSQEDFEITYFKNLLKITGCRTDENSSIKAFHQLEIGYGEFLSTIEINIPIQVDKAEATYKNGFLLLKLPKAQPKSIQIKE
ncbi:MAG TPA: Hsp20/alpha crystallin family protein [Anaerolineaceae bacterium]|nr:Hsp20/alpha crystallin family protein [Anaerolineaceae bacterium]